jgi:hypothetical protein
MAEIALTPDALRDLLGDGGHIQSLVSRLQFHFDVELREPTETLHTDFLKVGESILTVDQSPEGVDRDLTGASMAVPWWRVIRIKSTWVSPEEKEEVQGGPSPYL